MPQEPEWLEGEVTPALRALGEWAAAVRWPTPEVGADVLRRVLFDSLAVTIAGGRLPEMHQLRRALPAGPGPATVLGDRDPRSVTDAAWCNGVAMVALELDEGNKRARGHAAAHCFPAAWALAEALGTTGPELAAALLVGHEVASRFGRATTLRAGVHPHGTWGVAGAAAAAARLNHLGGAQTAAALDAASTLALAAPFEAALAGEGVRHMWIGQANEAGVRLAALAATGDGRVSGLTGHSLGRLLGTFDATALVDRLGRRVDLDAGYFKRHACCSYTHPPADIAIDLWPLDDVDGIAEIEVATHRLAAGLDRLVWPTRLAAMFSIPFVVAVALTDGVVGPGQFDDAHRLDPAVASLAAKVRVVHDPDLDLRLPAERVARLRFAWRDGTTRTIEATNPVGDSDHGPLDDAALRSKVAGLIGDPAAERLADLTSELLEADDVRRVFGQIRQLAASTPSPDPERRSKRGIT